MNFSEALAECRKGKKVFRKGWNAVKLGKKIFVAFQKGYPNGIEINTNTSEALGLPEKTKCAFLPYLMLAQETDADGIEFECIPWTPSQNDQIQEDWDVVEEEK